MIEHQSVANDNFEDTGDMRRHLSEIAYAHSHDQRISSGQYMRNASPAYISKTAPITHMQETTQHRVSRPVGFIAIGLWMASVVFAILKHPHFTDYINRLYIFAPVVIASLFLNYAGRNARSPFAASIGAISVFTAMSLSVLAIALGLNLQISFQSLSIVTAILAMGLSQGLESKTSAFISYLCVAGWVYLTLRAQSVGAEIWVIPALLSWQLVQARKVHAPVLLWLSTNLIFVVAALLLYLWAGSGKISLQMGVSLGILAAIALSRIGKSIQDGHSFGGLLITNIGLFYGAILSIAYQDYWLNGAEAPWQKNDLSYIFSYTDAPIWIALSLSLIGVIFVSGLLRKGRAKQSISSVLTTTAVCAFIPAVLVFEDRPLSTYFAEISALDGKPAYILAGIVIGLALGVLANGLRRRKTSMVTFAFIVLCAQSAFIGQFLMEYPDNVLIFALSAVLSAMTAAVFVRHTVFERQIGARNG